MREIRRAEEHAGDCAYAATLFGPMFNQFAGPRGGTREELQQDCVGSLFRSRLFTLNYDRTVERSVPDLWPYLDLFTRGPRSPRIVSPSLRIRNNNAQQEHLACMLETRRSEGGGRQLALLEYRQWKRPWIIKLHGSPNWFFRKRGGEVVLCLDDSGKGDPEIILGTTQKLTMRTPYGDLFMIFKNACDESDLYVAIGYGRRDQHANDLVLEAHGCDMRVVDVRPLPPGVVAPHVPLGFDVQHVNATAEVAPGGRRFRFATSRKRWAGPATLHSVLYGFRYLSERHQRLGASASERQCLPSPGRG